MDCWCQTFTGKKVDVLFPDPGMVDIVDIAHALSMTCRYGGHCRDFYSVAEHSLLVEEYGGRDLMLRHDEFRLALLLHDAAEAYIGAVVSPVRRALRCLELSRVRSFASTDDDIRRLVIDSVDSGDIDPRAIGSSYSDLKEKWLVVIGQKFGIGDLRAWPQLKTVEAQVMAREAPLLFHPMQESWWTVVGHAEARELQVHCWSPTEARRRFLAKFFELFEVLHGKPGRVEVSS